MWSGRWQYPSSVFRREESAADRLSDLSSGRQPGGGMDKTRSSCLPSTLNTCFQGIGSGIKMENKKAILVTCPEYFTVCSPFTYLFKLSITHLPRTSSWSILVHQPRNTQVLFWPQVQRLCRAASGNYSLPHCIPTALRTVTQLVIFGLECSALYPAAPIEKCLMRFLVLPAGS